MSSVYRFPGRIHPQEGIGGKAATAGLPIVEVPQPSRMAIPLQQHIGAPCKPLVQKGDTVKAGQKIGEPVGFVSAAVHASISGKVVDVLPCIVANGTQVNSVVIDNDFQDTWVELHPVADPEKLNTKELADLCREMGIVGMGGATFPTAVRLFRPRREKSRYVGHQRCGMRTLSFGGSSADAGKIGRDQCRGSRLFAVHFLFLRSKSASKATSRTRSKR